MKIFAETERLILREVLLTDVEGMFELDSNMMVHQYLGNNPINSKEQAIDAINFIRQQYEERGVGRWAAIEKESGDFIGWTGLKLNTGEKESLNGRQNFYDLGYRFIPRYWGKGYASETAFPSLDYGFKNLNIETMCGAAEVKNIGSNKILQKIGLNFIEEFMYKDEKINWYELNKEDYEKRMS